MGKEVRRTEHRVCSEDVQGQRVKGSRIKEVQIVEAVRLRPVPLALSSLVLHGARAFWDQ